MHTLVVGTQKGGSGKSTIATGLAVAAMEAGQRVGVVETDPQGTLSSWSRRRASPEPRMVSATAGIDIERALLSLRRHGCTLALIDTPATNNLASVTAFSVAEFCLIPARPSPADIEAALPTLAAIRNLGKPFAFVLNQTPARSFRLSEAAMALNNVGVLALPYIVQRTDHQDALGAGLGVTEFAPQGKAAEEIRGLWRWVWKELTARSYDDAQTRVRAIR
jgi:chromosome partitioning protein